MAARLRPDRVQAARQPLHPFVAQPPWSDEAVLDSVRRQVLSAIERRGPIVAWIVERDYLELKQELGLGHLEGRSWRGFHHHAGLCIAARQVPGGAEEPNFGLGPRRIG